MIPPFLRSRGAIVTSTAATLKMPVPANSANDLAVVYVRGTPGSGNVGVPTLPGGWKVVYAFSNTTMYEVVGWRKVPPSGLGAQVVAAAGPDMVVAKGWWGYVDVFGSVGYPAYGFVDLPGVTGDYASYSRTTYAGTPPANLSFAVRVRVTAGATIQWFCGWGNADAGLGLSASNKIVVYVNSSTGVAMGNVESTAALPFPLDAPIWIRGDVATNGNCTYYYSRADINNGAAVDGGGLWTQLGTTVTGIVSTGVFRLTNSGTVYLGTRDFLEQGFAGDLLSYYEVPDITSPYPKTSLNFSEPQPDVVVVGAADIVYPTTQDGPESPIEAFGYNAPTPFPADGVAIATRYADGPDRLYYQSFVMEYLPASATAAAASGEITTPSTWTDYLARSAKVLTRTVKAEVMTLVFDDDAGEPVTFVGNSSVWYFALVIRGRSEAGGAGTAGVRPPLAPQPPRIALGCADSYNLFITDQTYRQRIEQVAWSRLKWERVLDDISKASATVPDRYGGLSCLAQVGGLVPWQYGILIERDDAVVWQGPVTNVARRGTDLQVEAADVLVRYQKRLAKRGLSVTYTQADAGRILYDLFTTHAYLASDAWEFPVPQVNAQVPITRTLWPRELKMAWDLVSELLDDSIDAYVMNGTMYVWEPGTGWCYQGTNRRVLDGPYNVNYDFVYGTFTDDAWVERPDWSIDGPGQANYVAVPGVESGEFGYRRIEVVENAVSQARYGVLDHVDADRVELPEDVHPTIEQNALRNRARTVIALRAFAPAVVSGGELSESAPIDVDHLRPGSLWKLDVWDHGFGQLLTAGRLRRVEVDVTVEQSGIKESVTPTLSPPGWEGEEL